MSVLAIDAGTTGAAAQIVTADGTVAGPQGQEIRLQLSARRPYETVDADVTRGQLAAPPQPD